MSIPLRHRWQEEHNRLTKKRAAVAPHDVAQLIWLQFFPKFENSFGVAEPELYVVLPKCCRLLHTCSDVVCVHQCRVRSKCHRQRQAKLAYSILGPRSPPLVEARDSLFSQSHLISDCTERHPLFRSHPRMEHASNASANDNNGQGAQEA